MDDRTREFVELVAAAIAIHDAEPNAAELLPLIEQARTWIQTNTDVKIGS